MLIVLLIMMCSIGLVLLLHNNSYFPHDQSCFMHVLEMN